MLRSGKAVDGTPAHSGVSRVLAETIARVTADRQPAVSIEVGMAFGFSTLSILSGSSGEVVSIDPNQSTQWEQRGVHAVEAAGYADRHRVIEKPSYLALPQLAAEGTRAQFAYIDGWHTFDYVLLDFFYVDKMLETGGVVAFNDSGWDAIWRVIRFVQTHRRYREVDVGLPRQYLPNRNPLKRLQARMRGQMAQDRYFTKLAEYEPNWNFYRRF